MDFAEAGLVDLLRRAWQERPAVRLGRLESLREVGEPSVVAGEAVERSGEWVGLECCLEEFGRQVFRSHAIGNYPSRQSESVRLLQFRAVATMARSVGVGLGEVLAQGIWAAAVALTVASTEDDRAYQRANRHVCSIVKGTGPKPRPFHPDQPGLTKSSLFSR